MDLVEKKSDVCDRHPWETARLKVIFNIFKKYYNKDKSTTIVDIGCGDVYIAENFAKKYPKLNYIAIDTAFNVNKIDEFNKIFAAKGIENVMLYSCITDINKDSSVNADYVFLFDVLEHTENDVDFLKYLLNSFFISKDTKIFISVPAYNCLFTSHDVYLKHYRRYNKSMLKQVAKESGLIIREKGDFFSILLFPKILKTIIERLSNNNEYKNYGIGGWKSKGFIDNFFISLLYIDYLVSNTLRCMGINLPGLSKFMICKKSV